MKKDIEINGITCHFKSSAAIPRIYRIKFRRDIFVDMAKIQKNLDANEKLKNEMREQAKKKGEEFDETQFESQIPIDSLEMFENIAYLMHKHGDASQPGNIDDWLDQFETFNIYEILPAIVEMWGSLPLRVGSGLKFIISACDIPSISSPSA